MTPILVWFRRDLRLSDHPALAAAAATGRPVIALFIRDVETDRPGAASRWWLHHSLSSLAESLKAKGSSLVLRSGPSEKVLRDLVRETGAGAVYWSRLYDPVSIERDTRIKSALKADGVEVESFNASLLFEPWEMKNKTGRPFQVFTPFWKACLAVGREWDVEAAPKKLSAPSKTPKSEELLSWALLPRIPWDARFRERFEPGEEGANKALKQFLRSGVNDYADARDVPGIRGTSRLSPHLHFGEISPRQIVTQVEGRGKGPQTFVKEIGWREFAHHLLFHFPQTLTEPLRPEFKDFPWSKDTSTLPSWKKGLTGYPIVDAGMRELWTTGWMHNRVRMIVASFLVKDLRLPWQTGADWFWDTLVDADPANNTLGWQWAAGCGADAAPYFRVFNPTLQGERFDPEGTYVREWIPELANLESKWIHRPWEAPDEVRARIRSYPNPIVDHGQARDDALAAFKKLKKAPV